jgi:hypothetical protein
MQGVSVGTSNVEAGDESAEKLSETLFSEELKDWDDVYRTNVTGYVHQSLASAKQLIYIPATSSRRRLSFLC